MAEVSTVVLVCVFIQSLKWVWHTQYDTPTSATRGYLTQCDKSTLLLRNVCFDEHINDYIKFY